MIRQLRIKEEVLYSSDNYDQSLMNPKLETELNMSGSLTFSITKENSFYSKLEKLTTYIDYYEDDVWIWGGRVVDTDDDYDNIKNVYCEGYLSFLIDSQFQPFLHQGSIKELFDKIINSHNSQVEIAKRFIIGTVSVVDNNNYIRRESESYISSIEALKTRLVDTHKGYLNIRKVGESLYLDYLSGFGRVAEQTIEFGENLLDLNKHISSKSICSVIIPLGAEIDDGSDKPKRIDIKSVNNGKLSIESPSAIQKYGRITGIVYFDDVTLPVNLLAKAKEYLSEVSAIGETIEISAVDLSTINVNYKSFKLGDWVNITSEPHNLSSKMMLSKLVRSLDDASQDTITLGSVLKSYTSSQTKESVDITTKIEQTNNTQYQFINDAIKNTTDLIMGGKGGYVVWGFNEQGQPEELFFLDTPEVSTARTVLRLNKNGIAGSTAGINGPYQVGMLLDGSINANRITSGEINAVNINGVKITGAEINGGTIKVNSDITVGNNILLGLQDNDVFKSIKFNNDNYVSFSSQGLAFNANGGVMAVKGNGLGYVAKGGGASLNLLESGFSLQSTPFSINASSATSSTSMIAKDSLKLQANTSSGVKTIIMNSSSISSSQPIIVSSDRRLKENIEEVDMYTFLDLIKIKSFNYLGDEQSTIGVVAQDYFDTPLERFFVRESDGNYAVDYNAVSMVGVSSIKRLKKEVERLTSENILLKNRIKKIEEVLSIVNDIDETED